MPTNEPGSDDGSTALLLLESLIYELVAGGIISTERAVTVVESASEAQAELAAEQGSEMRHDGGKLGQIIAMLRLG